uniref:Uncharacterized protein n=1 Tax=Ciona intestinalis TaxID=7719 RepID=H2Y3N4_CIOIN
MTHMVYSYTSCSLSSYNMGVFLYTRHTWCIHTPHAHCQVITWVSSYTPDTHSVFIQLTLTVEL